MGGCQLAPNALKRPPRGSAAHGPWMACHILAAFAIEPGMARGISWGDLSALLVSERRRPRTATSPAVYQEQSRVTAQNAQGDAAGVDSPLVEERAPVPASQRGWRWGHHGWGVKGPRPMEARTSWELATVRPGML